MSGVLLFRLYGPMQAFGDIAVGERRVSFSRPSRSGILGLVAGALGYRRENHTAHRQLSDGIRYASATPNPGVLLTDYHTAQLGPRTPTLAKKLAKAIGRPLGTRRDVLSFARHDITTAQSWRDYRCDALSYIALEGRSNASVTLDEIKSALEQPVFAPFLGRRSCPPSMPFSPRIIDAKSPLDGLQRTVPFAGDEEWLAPLLRTDSVVLAWEGGVDDAPKGRVERRRDGYGSRTARLFSERREHVTIVASNQEKKECS